MLTLIARSLNNFPLFQLLQLLRVQFPLQANQFDYICVVIDNYNITTVMGNKHRFSIWRASRQRVTRGNIRIKIDIKQVKKVGR